MSIPGCGGRVASGTQKPDRGRDGIRYGVVRKHNNQNYYHVPVPNVPIKNRGASPLLYTI